MENKMIAHAKDALQKKTKEVEGVQLTLKNMYDELRAITAHNCKLHCELANLYRDWPSGLSTAKRIIEKNEKIMDTIKQRSETRLEVIKSLDVEDSCVVIDEFTMESDQIVQAEIERLKEVVRAMKKDTFENAKGVKAAEEVVEKEINEVVTQTRAFEMALIELENEGRELMWQLEKPMDTADSQQQVKENVQDLLQILMDIQVNEN